MSRSALLAPVLPLLVADLTGSLHAFTVTHGTALHRQAGHAPQRAWAITKEKGRSSSLPTRGT